MNGSGSSPVGKNYESYEIQKLMPSVAFSKDVRQVGQFWSPDLMFETSDWNDLRCAFVCKHTHINHLFLFIYLFLINTSWKDERFNVSVTLRSWVGVALTKTSCLHSPVASLRPPPPSDRPPGCLTTAVIDLQVKPQSEP